jgi:excisionase family DNA binding protein
MEEGEFFVVMAKPRFAQMEVVVDNPPDKHGFTTFTIIRNIGRSGHHYERHVELNDLLSSPEAARILRISVRHLYRLVKEGRIKYKKLKTHLWFVSRDVQRVQLARRRISGRRETFLIN